MLQFVAGYEQPVGVGGSCCPRANAVRTDFFTEGAVLNSVSVDLFDYGNQEQGRRSQCSIFDQDELKIRSN